MDDETRDALRERNRSRRGCPNCGNLNVNIMDGADFGPLDDGHFPGFKYKVCPNCGYEKRVK